VHSLRRAFVRQLGVTPQWYRAQFQKTEAARDVI
jgi:AraC-like DNA-binding protein